MERIAQRVKRQELSLVAQADATLVVSEEERTLLAEEIPGAEVRVVSNIHRIPGSAKSFEERADLMFVGGFAHPPNRDAVLYFCREVLPRILTSLPEARLFVIGSDPPPEIRCLESDQVHILGYVPDIEPFLNNCRVSVAPLRFGAGVKGKINQSLAYGLPVVGTTIAVEGMFLKNGESVLIADDARSFADAVVKLFRDAALWNKLSTGGLAVMEEHFSFAAVQRAVGQLLAS
jgi:glycosyltransferase involved in cell wall biosynthesis